MTEKEKEILDYLAMAWDLFVDLSPLTEWERIEFMFIIHQAQNLVAARHVFQEALAEDESG